jgi:hypothetical protein
MGVGGEALRFFYIDIRWSLLVSFTPDRFILGKWLLVPTEQEAVLSSKPVETFWKRIRVMPLPGL